MSALIEFADGKLSGVHGALDADDHVLVKLQVVAPMLDFGAEVLTAEWRSPHDSLKIAR